MIVINPVNYKVCVHCNLKSTRYFHNILRNTIVSVCDKHVVFYERNKKIILDWKETNEQIAFMYSIHEELSSCTINMAGLKFPTFTISAITKKPYDIISKVEHRMKQQIMAAEDQAIFDALDNAVPRCKHSRDEKHASYNRPKNECREIECIMECIHES